jgi:sulfite reductase (ferredoxin)
MSGTATTAQRIQQDVVEVHDAIERYLTEGIPDDEFTPFRVARGIYGQRRKGVNMLRVKIPCGRVNSTQLRRIAEVTAEYASGKAHITTRQDFQMYDVPTARVPDCLAVLAEAGLTTREAGGRLG